MYKINASYLLLALIRPLTVVPLAHDVESKNYKAPVLNMKMLPEKIARNKYGFQVLPVFGMPDMGPDYV